MSRSEMWESDPTGHFDAALVDDDPVELYEHAPCGYLSFGPDGTILKVNATLLGWTGHDAADLVGVVRFQDLLSVGDRIFFETHISPMLRLQGRARELAVELRRRDGERFPALLNLVVADTAGGEQVTRAAVFDATERRAYERELLAARRRAELAEARSSALAQTLQSTFVPPAPPATPGLEIGGAYRPSGDGREVGGDFYDVFVTAPGSWVVGLGDVCGKGAEAAVLTALARHTIRVAAMHSESPAVVLGEVHDAFMRYHPDTFCTAVLAVVAPVEHELRITMAAGGHPLPSCRRADGAWERLGRPGTMLGMLEVGRWSDVDVTIGAGDLLVLATDGVTEARDAEGTFFGDARLQAAVDEVADADAQAIADHLVEAALGFQHGDARDDIAVVVLRAGRSGRGRHPRHGPDR